MHLPVERGSSHWLRSRTPTVERNPGVSSREKDLGDPWKAWLLGRPRCSHRPFGQGVVARKCVYGGSGMAHFSIWPHASPTPNLLNLFLRSPDRQADGSDSPPPGWWRYPPGFWLRSLYRTPKPTPTAAPPGGASVAPQLSPCNPDSVPQRWTSMG